MIIRTFDGQEYIVSQEQGEKIKSAIMSDDAPDWIEIRESMVRVSTISAVKPGGYTSVDPEIKQLVEGYKPSPHRIGTPKKMDELLRSRPIKRIRGGETP